MEKLPLYADAFVYTFACNKNSKFKTIDPNKCIVTVLMGVLSKINSVLSID